MENASQALLIGAGVLIGVIILSMAVYLFGVFGSHSANIQSQIDANQVAQFNDKFLRYAGLTDLTIQDVITVKNYALESNHKVNSNYDYKTCRPGEYNEYIDVWYETANRQTLVYKYTDEELLKDNIDSRFTCNVQVNSTTGLVIDICFIRTN